MSNEFSKKELALIKQLDTPVKIQDFLNSFPVDFNISRDTCASPLGVLRKRKAHCIEGALLAAHILATHGKKPLIMDLRATSRDLDHVVALFRENGRWGAISKTNYAVLRYREPIFKTIHELALSYFHEYTTHDGTKTLREFSEAFNVSRFDKKNWQTDPNDLWYIAIALDDSPHVSIIPKKLIHHLRKADPIEIKAGKLVEWKK